jgi:hypothetical protein
MKKTCETGILSQVFFEGYNSSDAKPAFTRVCTSNGLYFNLTQSGDDSNEANTLPRVGRFLYYR